VIKQEAAPEPDLGVPSSPEPDLGMRTAPPPIEDVYAAHAGSLSLLLFAYTGDLAEAQDLVQEAFCRALPRWQKISRYDDPVAWLRKVAFNLAASRWRRLRTAARHRWAPEVHVPEPSPDRVLLVAALAQLPESQRRALVLHYLADLTTADIARHEDVADSTVRVWLHRGRKALATLLDAQEDPHV
jgi:RNA polymerase sigma-70 factor (ECF subfamily)